MRSEANKAKIEELITGLPGESLVRQGLADAQAGRLTAEACLISMGRPRLSRAGLLAGIQAELQPEPDLSLYRRMTKNSTLHD